jgi:hypothetical protein
MVSLLLAIRYSWRNWSRSPATIVYEETTEELEDDDEASVAEDAAANIVARMRGVYLS